MPIQTEDVSRSHEAVDQIAVDDALVRATAHSGDLAVGLWPDLGNGAEADRWCAWFAQIWASVAEAVMVASPVLASRVAAACSGRRPHASRARSMAMSLARYLVRMRGRATPFGLFAGVAPLRFDQEPLACWSEVHYARVRADAVWLAGVIDRLESCPMLRHRLTVVVNDLAFVRGERLVLPWQPHAGNRDRSTPAEVSVRHSKAVQTIMHGAQSPIRVGDLLDKLATEIPGAAMPAIDAMLAELIARGVLITSLRPPSTTSDGLAHVLGQLDRVQADALEEVAPLVAELRGIHTQLDAGTRASSWLDGRARRATADRMRAVSAVDQPLMVDLRLGCTVVLPPQVAAEAEKAAGALLLLTSNPAGHPALFDYHTSFLNRFGVGCLIPIDQLVDPVTGLGFPAHYRQPGQPAISAGISRRGERLLALAQQAALDGAREVVLDETALDDLAGGDAEMRPAAHGELCAEVWAPTMAALTEGAFTLVVSGVGRTALAMAGRFLDLLPDDDQERMIRRYDQLPVAVKGAVRAQLSFPPKHPRMENVARAPLVLPEVICLAEHRDGVRGRIPLRDLAVTADTERLYVVSLSRRRVVEPTLANAAALHAVPPIARLLFEIPRARSAMLALFAWGAAACLPFRPRVLFRTTKQSLCLVLRLGPG